MAKLKDLQSQMAEIQAKLDLARAQTGNLPARPLPDRPLGSDPKLHEQIEAFLAKEAAGPTLGDTLKKTANDLRAVGMTTLGLAPLGLHPVGMAINTGVTLGGLATAGMRLYEREQNRRLGTPRERAEEAYGKGIEARIQRNASKGRKFR